MTQAKASILGSKAPVNGGLSLIASLFDGRRPADQRGFIGHVRAELAQENAELDGASPRTAMLSQLPCLGV